MARPLYGGEAFGQGLPPSSYIDPYAAYSFGYRSEQPPPAKRAKYVLLAHDFLNAACRSLWRAILTCVLFVQDAQESCER